MHSSMLRLISPIEVCAAADFNLSVHFSQEALDAGDMSCSGGMVGMPLRAAKAVAPVDTSVLCNAVGWMS